MKKYMLLSILALFILMIPVVQAQTMELKFSHKLHSESVGAGCSDCHEAAGSSTNPADDMLPAKESCFNCHDSEAECSLCHTDVDNAVAMQRVQTYIAKFPHAKHVSDKMTCEKCHEGIALSETVQGDHLPKMPVCSDCHTDLEKPAYCYDCHNKGESLTPADHRLDWARAHGVQQQNYQQECKMCHTDNSCIACHQKGNLDRKTHPLNFINNHGILARGNKEQCRTCHEDENYCVSCHREQMVMPRTHDSAGWSNPRTGGTHARAARADLDDCLVCHGQDQAEPICAQCHPAK